MFRLTGRTTMTMHRRDFLKAGAALSVAATLPKSASAQVAFAPQPGAWCNFQITTRLDIANPAGGAKAWVPLPSVNEDAWIRALGSEWKTNAKSATIERDAKYDAAMLTVAWADGETAPSVEVTSRIATRDRPADLTHPRNAPPLSAAERKFYTEGTDLIPVDGIVKETA